MISRRSYAALSETKFPNSPFNQQPASAQRIESTPRRTKLSSTGQFARESRLVRGFGSGRSGGPSTHTSRHLLPRTLRADAPLPAAVCRIGSHLAQSDLVSAGGLASLARAQAIDRTASNRHHNPRANRAATTIESRTPP